MRNALCSEMADAAEDQWYRKLNWVHFSVEIGAIFTYPLFGNLMRQGYVIDGVPQVTYKAGTNPYLVTWGPKDSKYYTIAKSSSSTSTWSWSTLKPHTSANGNAESPTIGRFLEMPDLSKLLGSILMVASCGSNSSEGAPDAMVSDAKALPANVNFILESATDFEIRIDGQATPRFEVSMSRAEYLAAEILVESVHPVSGRVVDSRRYSPRCPEHQESITTESQTIQVTQMGQLTRGSIACEGGKSFVGDGFLHDVCEVSWTCGDNQRCGLGNSHVDPPLFQLKCTDDTAGGGNGTACQFSAVGPSSTDNCATGFACVDSTCRRFCFLEAAGACSDVEDYQCLDTTELSWVGLGVCGIQAE
jgi:hypothetical protein